MKISEIIRELKKLKKKHGDIEVIGTSDGKNYDMTVSDLCVSNLFRVDGKERVVIGCE